MKTLPGRFSVISPVNLINMLELGIDNYKKIIEGVKVWIVIFTKVIF